MNLSAVPGEAMVRLRDTRSERRLVEDYELRVQDRFQPGGELLHVRLGCQEDLERLQQDPRVLYAEPNYKYGLDEVQQAPSQWQLPKVEAAQAWQLAGTGPAPIVAVLDTGVDSRHPALAGNMWVNEGEIAGDGLDNDGNGVIDDVHGYNANADTGDCSDAYGHGTHVAGILGANSPGVQGMHPRARIMSIRIHDEHGSTNAAAIARGLRYAQRMGATITNNSWGGPKAAYSIREAFAAFPALHVMSAGNAGKNNDFHSHYPGNFDLPNKLVVAASDRNDGRPSFSNYGRGHVDLAAPGEDIYSTLKDGQYGLKSGTSMAAPLVAGTAALLATLHPDWTPGQLREAILAGADVLPQWKGTVASGARLNAARALQT